MAAAHAVLRHVRTLAVRQRTLRGISHRRLLTTTIRLRHTFGAVRVLFTPGSHYGPLEKQVSLDCTGGSPSLRCPGEGATRTGL